MPAKILLADKSITIQKVVEMLFSGKDYEVTCVSDGENALSEAARIRPDVILADVDLPRIDGYSLAVQARQQAALAQIPIILMLSRDDQYDVARGSQAGIMDNIAKPFESKDLINKVKKALSAAPAKSPDEPAPARPMEKPAAPPPPPRHATPLPPPPKPKQAVPSDIFGIIEEAPGAAAAAKTAPSAPQKAAAPQMEESVFEVEPEIEVEPEVVAPSPRPAPTRPAVEAVAREWKAPVEGPQRMEPDAFDTEKLFGRETTAGAGEPEAVEIVQAEVVSEPAAAGSGFDTFDIGGGETVAEAEKALPLGARAMEEMREGLGLGRAASGGGKTAAAQPPDFVSFENLDDASRVSNEDYAPPSSPQPRQPVVPRPAPPGMRGTASEAQLQSAAQDAIAQVAREVLERVAWEVIPELAERMIREEIERLKAGR